MAIDWNHPNPGTGVAGALDKVIGPDATAEEVVWQIGVPTVACIIAPIYAFLVVAAWPP